MDEILKEYHFGFALEMVGLSTSMTLIIFGEPTRQLVTRLYGEKSAVRTSKWCYEKESNNVTDNLLFRPEFFDKWATLPGIEACTRLLGMMKFQSNIFSNCNVLYSVPHLLPPVMDEIEKLTRPLKTTRVLFICRLCKTSLKPRVFKDDHWLTRRDGREVVMRKRSSPRTSNLWPGL
jgi:hypothetical protein